eukprot:gene34589-39108_t
MLEHVPDPAAIVRAAATLVKPGGHVFFSTLNRNPKSYLFAVIGAEYVLRMLPRGTHDYAKFITPAELSQYVRSAGLQVNGLKGLGYNPLSKIYSLNDDTSVNYMVATSRTDLEQFAARRADQETDMSGTLRGALAIEARAVEIELFPHLVRDQLPLHRVRPDGHCDARAAAKVGVLGGPSL